MKQTFQHKFQNGVICTLTVSFPLAIEAKWVEPKPTNVVLEEIRPEFLQWVNQVIFEDFEAALPPEHRREWMRQCIKHGMEASAILEGGRR